MQFNIHCQASGEWTNSNNAIKCEAVECGKAKTVANANWDKSKDYYYPEESEYTCKTGYSLDAKYGGSMSFKTSCEPSGQFEGFQQCQPVECGKLGSQKDATIQDDREYVFGQSVTVTCHTGYSIDRSTTNSKKSYTVACKDDGNFASQPTCERITCNSPPSVTHTTWDSNEKFYEDEVTYELAEGWTLNGQHDGEKEFKITCQSDGTFTTPSIPQRVICGPPPSRPHSGTSTTESLKFDDEAEFVCGNGYTLNGEADGESTYKLKCTASSDFEGPDGCQAVKCGALTLPDHSEKESGDLEMKYPNTVELQ
jgi:hypothetical protein